MLDPRGGARLFLRWVTWWPTQYWADRFDELGRQLGQRFEAVFLAEGDAHYEGLELYPELWQFRYRVLSKTKSAIGFYRPARVPRNPLPIVMRRPHSLVMTYADPTYFVAAMLARICAMPYHLFVANTVHDEREESRRNELLKKWIFSRASSCLATGPYQAEYARRYAGKTPVTEIGNPVDNMRLAPKADALRKRRDSLRTQLGWSPDDFVVLFVGRLAPEKDLSTLLRAVGRLRDIVGHVSVVLVGTGPDRDALRSLSEVLRIDVRFHGFRQGAPLHDVYAAADVFVLPSTSEAWGLVVNEAMMFSLPVIVSDRVGSRHLIESGGGFVFPSGDDAALADVLQRLSRSEALRQGVGVKARTIIEPHTVERWVDTVLSALRAPT